MLKNITEIFTENSGSISNYFLSLVQRFPQPENRPPAIGTNC